MTQQHLKNKNTIVYKEIEIIPKKFYFISTDKFIHKDEYFDFNIDNILQYTPFHDDFGPLKISLVYKYIKQVERLMNDPQQKQKIFWHVTSINPKKYTNSIFLICAYQIFTLKKNAQEAYKPFQKYSIVGFRDSIAQKSVYECPILDCLKGLQKAAKLQLFSLQHFNLDKYSHYEKLQNGDFNQIIEQKLYAFSLPHVHQKDRFGKSLNSISKVISKLKQLKIKIVINFCSAPQFETKLKNEGIQIHTMQIQQNNTPDTLIIDKFCQIIQTSKHKIGVFCRSGFGKSATMICIYAIRQLNFTAPEAIGWLRIFRPGSVIGSEQTFLLRYSNNIRMSKPKSDEKVRQTQNNSLVNNRPSGSLDRRVKKNQIDQKIRVNSINKLNKYQSFGVKKIYQLMNVEHAKPEPTILLQNATTNEPKNIAKNNLTISTTIQEGSSCPRKISSQNECLQIKLSIPGSSETKHNKICLSYLDDQQQGLSPSLKLLLNRRMNNNKKSPQKKSKLYSNQQEIKEINSNLHIDN